MDSIERIDEQFGLLPAGSPVVGLSPWHRQRSRTPVTVYLASSAWRSCQADPDCGPDLWIKRSVLNFGPT